MSLDHLSHSSLHMFEIFQVAHCASGNEGGVFHAVERERGAHMGEAFLVRMGCCVAWGTVEVFTFWTVKDGSFLFAKCTICRREM